MAYLRHSCRSICRGFQIREASSSESWKNSKVFANFIEVVNTKKKKTRVVVGRGRWQQFSQCCSSSCSSSSSSTSFTSAAAAAAADQEVELGGKYGDREGLFGYLIRDYCGWQVRRMFEEDEEMRKVAQVQAEAFHVPLLLFNDLFFLFFQAEVLSGLLYRLWNSPPDRYSCLVAEPSSSDVGVGEAGKQELVGVVDVTVLDEETILHHLQGADEYLYVSGIAVANNFRRQKVGTALLKACEKVSVVWGFQYVVLRAYEDDWGARNLYTKAGFKIVSGDPHWMTTWIGRKRRLLMIKKVL